MKRVILSGATGAIGTAIIRELIAGGVEVLVLCREGSKRSGRIPDHPLVTRRFCSLEDFGRLENDTGREYDVFYHLAWEGTTGQARNDMFLQNRNVRYALDAVDLAQRFGCKAFVGVGSQAEYGRVEGVLTPDTPVHPETGYGIGKLTAGLMTRERAHQLGLRHIWVRVLSIYGPNDGPQSMVMSTIAALRAGRTPALTKGEQIWDYLYSGDAARAFVLLGDRGVDGRVYLLGSGTAKPLREYIETIRDLVSPGAALGFGQLPYSDRQVMYLCADISRLTEDTGWRPAVPFEQGIASILLRE